MRSCRHSSQSVHRKPDRVKGSKSRPLRCNRSSHYRTCLGCSSGRSEEHTSELQSQSNIVCRLLLEKKNAFSRSGWLWPVDAKGEPLNATSYMAVGFYEATYVNNKSYTDLAAKRLGATAWYNSPKPN